jgi:hypothetical protein
MDRQERKAAEEALRELSLSHGGKVTAELMFSLAKGDKNSPFRPVFEWNKAKAFESFNVDLARKFIASVKVVVRTERVRVSAVAYTRDPDCAADEQGYISVDTAKEDPDLKQRVLVQEFARISGHLYRARNLAKYFDLENEVSDLIDDLGVLKQSVEDLHV